MSELSLEQRAQKRAQVQVTRTRFVKDFPAATIAEMNLARQVEELRDALLQSPCNCLYRPVSGKREREIIPCRRCEVLARTEVL